MAGGLAEALRAQWRLDIRESEDELGDLVQQLAVFFERHQNGGLNLLGLRLELRTVVPTEEPLANRPNIVLVDVANTPTIYVWIPNTTTWTAV